MDNYITCKILAVQSKHSKNGRPYKMAYLIKETGLPFHIFLSDASEFNTGDYVNVDIEPDIAGNPRVVIVNKVYVDEE